MSKIVAPVRSSAAARPQSLQTLAYAAGNVYILLQAVNLKFAYKKLTAGYQSGLLISTQHNRLAAPAA